MEAKKEAVSRNIIFDFSQNKNEQSQPKLNEICSEVLGRKIQVEQIKNSKYGGVYVKLENYKERRKALTGLKQLENQLKELGVRKPQRPIAERKSNKTLKIQGIPEMQDKELAEMLDSSLQQIEILEVLFNKNGLAIIAVTNNIHVHKLLKHQEEKFLPSGEYISIQEAQPLIPKCFKCNKWGVTTNKCNCVLENPKCNTCGKADGHKTVNCETPTEEQVCAYCGVKGHQKFQCPKSKQDFAEQRKQMATSKTKPIFGSFANQTNRTEKQQEESDFEEKLSRLETKMSEKMQQMEKDHIKRNQELENKIEKKMMDNTTSLTEKMAELMHNSLKEMQNSFREMQKNMTDMMNKDHSIAPRKEEETMRDDPTDKKRPATTSSTKSSPSKQTPTKKSSKKSKVGAQ
jgi:hypothetical protein